MQSDHKTELMGKSLAELERLAAGWGRETFRGRQLFHWVYGREALRFPQMSDLPRPFRERLEESCQINLPKISRRFFSEDGAVRYLLELADGAAVETVYMPGERRDTLCLSSQVGCPLDCRFCFTALVGAGRDLTAGEIVGQVLAVRADARHGTPQRLNLVFMGMGEPFLNYANVLASVRILTHREGLAISPRRITVSTVGITPGIHTLATEPNRPKLAVSLNASSQQQRAELMPIARKYPLEKLIAACREFPLRPRERLTFEYVMLDGVNDSEGDAGRLVKLVKGIRSKVNLIPHNPGPEISYQPSSVKRILAFQEILRGRDIPAFIRRSRGRDIRAACGQLSLTRDLPVADQVSLPPSG